MKKLLFLTGLLLTLIWVPIFSSHGLTKTNASSRNGISFVEWNSDGSYLLLIKSNPTSEIFDAEVLVLDKDTLEVILKLDDKDYYQARWHPNGHWIAVISDKGEGVGKTGVIGAKVEIYDLDSSEFIVSIETAFPPVSLAFHPDGEALGIITNGFFMGKQVEIWQVDDPKFITQLEIPLARELLWSHDGNFLASIGITIIIWEISSYTPITIIERYDSSVLFGGEGPPLAAWSVDDKYLMTIGNNNWQDVYNIQVWDTVSGEMTGSLEGHECFLQTVTWSPDGKYLVSGDDSGVIKLWDGITWEFIKDLDHHRDAVTSIAWSPDNLFMASASIDGTLKIWQVVDKNVTLVKTINFNE